MFIGYYYNSYNSLLDVVESGDTDWLEDDFRKRKVEGIWSRDYYVWEVVRMEVVEYKEEGGFLNILRKRYGEVTDKRDIREQGMEA